MLLLIVVGMFVLLLIGLPLYVVLSLAPLVGVLIFTDISPSIMVARMFGGLDRFALMAVPFYVFAANLMFTGGLSKRMIRLADIFVGRYASGYALTTILACMFFAALSGSSPATVVAIGSIMFPILVENGYGENFSVGLLTSCGSIGIIIPPSINFILYGAVTSVSVGALYMGGFGAGIIYGLSFGVYAAFYARKRNIKSVQSSANKTFAEKKQIIKESLWALGVPVVIIGGIYTGKFTPTEAAGVSVVYSAFVGLAVYKELSISKIFTEAKKAAVITAQIMILVAAASFFSWVLTREGLAQIVASSATLFGSSKILFLLMTNVILLILGMFIDAASATLIVAPLLAPIASSLGVDLVHFGIIVTTNLAIGMFTPPFGLNLFVANSVSKMSPVKISRAVVPFIVTAIVALLVITYVPEITMFLPRLTYPIK